MGSEQQLEWPASRVRQTFIDYFAKSRDHLFVPSSPVLPYDDPTLLFANAGMNQFKPIFLGTVDPNSESAKWKRVANSQKCIRAGGKHNDLDDVGKDTYHHTFFEMLGNWSFGDYFKQEAIDWAWELLTNVYKLPADRLYVTYFRGDPANSLPADEEARQIWLKHLPASRVLPFGAKENFWEMGETGPCGPCSEIHFDRIGGRDASELVNRDDPMVIEIWNNVFIQFNREENGSLRPLPAKHVDTGMGLERIVSILQHKLSNYDTDVFDPIFQKIQQITGARPYAGVDLHDPIDTAYRVIADHIRTLSIAITDGILPNNDGRGYVLRRIVRRAVRFGAQFMNAKPGFFAQLTPVVVQQLGDFFSELRGEGNLERIMKVLNDEETAFRRTLQRGIKMFGKYADEARLTGSNVLSGADAFKLYDTFGFPIDLTLIMCQEKGMTVNMDEYRQEVRDAQERSAQGAKETTKRLALQADHTNQLRNVLNVLPTDDSFKYDWKDIDVRVIAIVRGGENGGPPVFVDSIDSVSGKDNVGLIFDRTNFYAESGGQTFDTGRVVVSSASAEFKVESVQVFAGYVLHIGHVFKGKCAAGDVCSLKPDFEMRKQIAANHTTTHSLNFALRRVLGHKQTIDQRGSLVAHDKLRFDFTHTSPVSAEELGRVEEIVRQQIRDDIQVYNKVVPLEEGRQINTLRAVFGEDYPSQVRVISIGASVDDMLSDPSNPKWMEYSAEFCGGTHLQHMKQAGDFALLTEEGIAKGVRRIVAVSKDLAKEAHANAAAYEQQVSELEKTTQTTEGYNIESIESRLTSLSEELKVHHSLPIARKDVVLKRIGVMRERITKARKEKSDELKKMARSIGSQLGVQAKERGDRVVVISEGLDLVLGDDKALSEVLDSCRKEHPNAAAIMIVGDQKKGRVFVKADVPDAFVKSKDFKASDWVSQTCAACKGKGGGKPTTAFGQGTDVNLAKEAIETARKFAEMKLN